MEQQLAPHEEETALQPPAAPHSDAPHLDASSWGSFGRFLLGNAGILFLLAGIVCFFAYNWEAMPPFGKFALLGGLTAGAACVAFLKGTRSIAGGFALLACGILGGVLLAVYGQVYQTGANAWELFRAWSFLLVPLVIIGRSAGLFFALWIVAGLWGFFYLDQRATAYGGHSYSQLYFLYQIAAHCLCLAVWEVAALFRPASLPMLRARWLPRVAAVTLLSLLTFVVVLQIIDPDDYLFGLNAHYLSIYAVTIVAGGLFYFFMRPELLLLAWGLLSIICICLTRLTVWVGVFFDLGPLLLLVLALIGMAVLAAKLLVAAHKRFSLREGYAKSGKGGWKRLFASLRGKRLPEAQPSGGPEASPWQARLLLGICAWITMPLLIALVAVLFGSALGIAGYIAVFLAMLACGLVIERQEGIFAGQAALCLCIAGSLTASSLLAVELELETLFVLPFLLIFAVSYFLSRSSAFRYLAATVVMCGVFMQIAVLFMENVPAYDALDDDYLLTVRAGFALALAAFCLWTVRTWLRRSAATIIHLQHEPILAAQITTIVLIGAVLPMLRIATWIVGSAGIWLLPFTSIGVASGIGLLYFFYRLGKELEADQKIRVLLYVLALAVALASWRLPWLGIGMLVLMLGRRAGSLVLMGVAILYLSTNTVFEYYRLSMTLMEKSFLLCGSGAVLLVGAYALHVLLGKPALHGGDAWLGSGEEQSSALPPQPDKGQSLARWALVAVMALFFAGFGHAVFQKERLLANGEQVILALRPLDPRSIMQGDYMILTFAIEGNINTALAAQARREADASPVLKGTAIAAPDNDGVYAFVRLDDGQPLQEAETRLVFRHTDGGIRVGSGSFFFQEGRSRDYDAAGFALMRVDRQNGDALTVRLLDRDRNPITPRTATP